MLFYYLLYFFVAVGAKLVLAGLMIYLLLPEDRRCSHCDGETLLLRPRPVGRLLYRLSLRRIQRRWCPRCGWEGLARRPASPTRAARHRRGTTANTRR